jgi:hypothetical protein
LILIYITVVVIVVFILGRVFVLCAVFRLIVVLFSVLCLTVVPMPPGKNPFAVKTNQNEKHPNSSADEGRLFHRMPLNDLLQDTLKWDS